MPSVRAPKLRPRPYGLLVGAAALLGAAICSGAMVVAVIAAAGAASIAAAGSMYGMTETASGAAHQHALLGLLIRVGPAVLITSILAMTVSVWLRRRWAAIAVLLVPAITKSSQG